MSEKPVIHIGENSPEQVAFKLLRIVGMAEDKMHGDATPKTNTDRHWILDTYAECLLATKSCRDI